MKKLLVGLLAFSLAAPVSFAKKQKEMSGNPIIKGWYADPEGIFMGGKYWIFPTYSAPYRKQLFFDAFSSTDLVHWEKHERVLEQKNIPWLRMALLSLRLTTSSIYSLVETMFTKERLAESV